MAHYPCSDCCGEGRVLIWLASQDPASDLLVFKVDYEELQSVYESMGLTVHFDDDWSGNIADYSLVLVDTPYTDPSWWATATGGGWTGRIVLITEYYSLSEPVSIPLSVSTWINSVSGATHGMTNNADLVDPATPSADGSIESEPLMSGLTTALLYRYTSTVSGGNTLSLTETGAVPWAAQNKVGTVDYVLCDSSALNDPDALLLAGSGSDNEIFAQNLWNVPV